VPPEAYTFLHEIIFFGKNKKIISQSLKSTSQFFHDQAEKRNIVGLKIPAEVCSAFPAEGHTPGETGEPGEFSAGSTEDDATGGKGDTDDLEDDPGGIKKGMGL
jgi:hypothetical protein